MNWNDVIMKKRKFSRWILLLCCLFIPAFTAGAKAPLGTPTREVLLDMAWDCLEEYNFSCIRTNAVAVSKATQIMSEKEEQTETQQVETEQTQEAETKQQTEEQNSETSFDVTQYIFSRHLLVAAVITLVDLAVIVGIGIYLLACTHVFVRSFPRVGQSFFKI